MMNINQTSNYSTLVQAVNPTYRYKTTVLKASVKRLLTLTKTIKGMTLKNFMNYMYALNKGYSKQLYKDAKCMINNLLHVIKLSNVDDIYIRKVVIEKAFTIPGIRYKARGSASRSCKQFCKLNIYLE